MIGEVRIRREDDDVPKDYMPKQVITKSKEEIEQRKRNRIEEEEKEERRQKNRRV
jgi:hypothetical protein